MVERYTLTSLDEIAETFGVEPPDRTATVQYCTSADRADPYRRGTGGGALGAGLLPPWRGHGGRRGPHLFEAPVDSLDHVPILRNAFRSQRCLIIADGFFLWQCTEKKSQPVWLHPAADPSRPGARSHTIAFAGVTARHRDDGQPSFAIVVGPASPLALPIAPAIPPHGYAAWLTGPRDRDRELLGIPPEGWRADPVSSWVNSKNHDDPRCVEPIGNPAQGELF